MCDKHIRSVCRRADTKCYEATEKNKIALSKLHKGIRCGNTKQKREKKSEQPKTILLTKGERFYAWPKREIHHKYLCVKYVFRVRPLDSVTDEKLAQHSVASYVLVSDLVFRWFNLPGKEKEKREKRKA